LLGLNSSTGCFDLAAPDGIVTRADFHRPSRALRPSSTVAEVVPLSSCSLVFTLL
jgi:hypothetical protein